MLALNRPDGTFLNISQARHKEWSEKYPGLDIPEQVKRANEWLKRNPSKAWKTLRGFEAWLQRSWENSPKAQKQDSASGQIRYAERVQRETEEREAREAAIPRPDYERVREMCGELMRSLPEYQRKEPERADYLRCEHTFTNSFYGGGEWCEKCGAFRGQWRAV